MHSSKVDESPELISELRAIIASDSQLGLLDDRKPYYASSIQYYKAKYLRDKRCLLTYLLWRQRSIMDAWWSVQDNSLSPSLAPAESSYLQEYDNVMVEYMTSFAIPLDLRAYLWRPPFFQQLEVRGLVNHTFVSPVTGNTVSIYTGKQVLLSFEEAESLLQQKVVELVQL